MYVNVVDQIRKVLTEESTVRGMYEQLQGERGKRMPPGRYYAEGDLFDRLLCDYEMVVERRALKKFFRTQVLAKLPPPPSVTVEDLEGVAFAQLSGVEDDEFPRAYDRFLHHVLFSIPGDGDEHGDTAFDFGVWSDAPGEAEEACLWESKASGFRFDLYMEAIASGNRADGLLVGLCTEAAMETVSRGMRRLAPSVIRSLVLVSDEARGRLADVCGKTLQLPLRPSFTVITSPFAQAFFAACCDAYFLDPAARSGILPQRIRTAVTLLAQADTEESPAAECCSSCWAAIAALVCEETPDNAGAAARNVVALLEPDGRRRRAPIRRVTEFYNRYRAAAAGEPQTGVPAGDVKATRRLAAAVLAAVVQWQGHQRRHRENADWGCLLDCLDEAEKAGRRMFGGADTFSHCIQEEIAP